MLKITISDHAITELLRLQAVESGRNWNYSRIEPAVDRLRYHVADRILTEIMLEISTIQECKRLQFKI